MPPTAINVAVAETASASHIKYRRDIDGLRAVAVVSVLLFHAYPQELTGGFVGVDVFFVISGFLITKVIATTQEQGTFSIADFYRRRIRRIFPALAVVLSVCLAVGWQTLVAEDLRQLAKHIVGGATFSSNLFLWQEAGYFDAASETKPLLHLWSLGIEEQFYIVWPLLMWLGMRKRVRPLLLIGVTALASFAVNILGVGEHPTAAFYSPAARAWELLLGAAMAFMPLSSSHAAQGVVRNGASVAGIALIVAAAVLLDSSRSFPGWWALLPVVGTCLAIWAGPNAALNRHLLSNRLMVGIGLISFPLYLWHWPLLTFGRELMPELMTGPQERSALLLTSVVLAWLTYQFVEKPLRFGPGGRLKAYGLGAVMLLIACSAAAIYKAEGAPSRYPDVIQYATRYDLPGFHKAMRWKTCFLEFGEGPTDFAPECIDEGHRPLVAIWGDSTAAAMFPGFRALEQKTSAFRLAQFTASGCPPLLGRPASYRPACPGTNKKAIAAIRQLKPAVVVLAANWQIYEADHLHGTIAALKDSGVPRVVVLGPGLIWNFPPSRIVLRHWRLDPLHRVPSPRLDYLKYGHYEGWGERHDQEFRRTHRTEEITRQIAVKAGAEYVSLVNELCNAEGCLMRAPDSGYSFFLDTSHLNPNGAEFLVRAIEPQLALGDPVARGTP